MSYYSKNFRYTKQGKNIENYKNQVTYKDKLIRITAYFSVEILKARREWDDAFQALKENTCHPSLLYPLREK
jgi:hypothetical protein